MTVPSPVDAGRDLDLEACAAEPIHIPGSIQPHGVLVAVEESTLYIARVSANAATLLGDDPERLLGRPLGEVLGGVDPGSLSGADLTTVNPFAVESPAGPLDAVAHRTGGHLVVELEPVGAGSLGTASFHQLRGALDRLQGARSLEALVDRAAQEVRRLTGFDRVMVYRFDAHWNGEVVAEARADELEPFLGLHFPAGDIPAQARDLYARSWLRLIVDRDYTPVPVLPSATAVDGAPLDLSLAVLRSVSPVHLEYLRNMGVVASMSISLLDRGRLWGLVSCHHTTGPLRPSLPVRAAAEFLGRTMSLLLPNAVGGAAHERSIAIRAAEGRIAARMGGGEEPATALAGTELLAVAGATGVAIRAEGRLSTAGDVPPPAVLDAIAASLLGGGQEAVGDAALASTEPTLAEWSHLAAGALAVRIGASADQWILCLRPEVLRTVRWGGDPTSKVVDEDDRIGPRRSFSAWSETMRGRSEPWTDEEVEAVARAARHTSSVLLQRARARESLAATLHRAILLEALPEVEGVDLCVQYRPAAEDALGGDWYDVFWLPGDRIAVVVGDVAGHGIAAAPVMAQLRHGLRAYLLKEATPGDALARLNELVTALLPADLASVVVADMDPATGEVRIASAGHPPVVVCDGAGAALLEGGRGPALGAVAEDRYSTVSLTLEPGASIIFYTDGLVERRGEDLDVGMDRLRQAVAAASDGGELQQSCDGLLELATGDDDVTILALRRQATGA